MIADTLQTLVLSAGSPLEHVVDHAQVKVGGYYVLTNHMIMMGVAAALMLLIFPRITRHYREGKLVPTGTRNFFEAIMVFIRNDVAKPLLGDNTDRFIPFLWTLFFFILFCNLLGLLPLDAIQSPFIPRDESGHPSFHAVYGTATANIAVTAVLAVVSFLLWNYWGIKANGIKAWAQHFLGGAPIYMAPVMVPVELLGMFVKPFALSIRLMANMTAGHVLLAVLTGVLTIKAFGALGSGGGVMVSIPIVLGAVGIMLLELFVAFLQAYIFTFLTTLFISQLVVHEHHDEHHEEHHEAPAGQGAEPHGTPAAVAH